MQFPRFRWGALAIGIGMFLMACTPAAAPAPTAAPAKPTEAAAKPASSPAVASPVAVASPSPSPSPVAAGARVMAELRDTNGQVVGSATFVEEGGSVRLVAEVRNLPPGPHGIHVHAVGRCDPPDFMSAAGHFNPTNKQHGLQNPSGPHAGDLPIIEIGADGAGRLVASTRELTLGAGANGVFDADGSALVIHASTDDQTTDPTGNSGGRIACGVIARG